MLKNITTICLAVVATFGIASATSESYLLKLNVQKGQQFVFRLAMEMSSEGIPVRMTGYTINHCLESKGESISWSNESKDLVIFANGERKPQEPSVAEVEQNTNGLVKYIAGDLVTEEVNRMSNLFVLTYPENSVTSGFEWTGILKGDPKAGVPRMEYRYLVRNLEMYNGRYSAVMNFQHRELIKGGATTWGTVAIDLLSGMPLWMDATFENLSQGGRMCKGTYRTEMVF